MKPGRAVADYIEQHTHLRGALQSALYQHEYRVIDDDFPYQELTLDQVGIPAWDILQISTERGDVYIELSKT
jgi:adenylyltransferase/sulfurtransferase